MAIRSFRIPLLLIAFIPAVVLAAPSLPAPIPSCAGSAHAGTVDEMARALNESVRSAAVDDHLVRYAPHPDSVPTMSSVLHGLRAMKVTGSMRDSLLTAIDSAATQLRSKLDSQVKQQIEELDVRAPDVDGATVLWILDSTSVGTVWDFADEMATVLHLPQDRVEAERLSDIYYTGRSLQELLKARQRDLVLVANSASESFDVVALFPVKDLGTANARLTLVPWQHGDIMSMLGREQLGQLRQMYFQHSGDLQPIRLTLEPD